MFRRSAIKLIILSRTNSRSMQFGGSTSKLNRRDYRKRVLPIVVDADKGGAISSIYDKQAKREIINTAKRTFRQ
jgi:hypothetical protein